MPKLRALAAVTANGNGPTLIRQGSGIRQNKFMWKKTGTGTATLNLVDVDTGIVLATDNIAATNPITGTHDLFCSDQVQAQVSVVTGSVVIDAWLDGWD